MVKIVHVHFDRGVADDEVHVYVHLDDATSLQLGSDIPAEHEEPTDTDTDVSSTDDALEAIYTRFVAYDATTPARKVVDTLRAKGWVAHAPKHRPATVNRAAYVRLTYAGTERSVTAYVQTNGVVVDRAADFELMKAQPGAVVAGRKVLFYFYGDDDKIELDDALTAVGVLRQAADGVS